MCAQSTELQQVPETAKPATTRGSNLALANAHGEMTACLGYFALFSLCPVSILPWLLPAWQSGRSAVRCTVLCSWRHLGLAVSSGRLGGQRHLRQAPRLPAARDTQCGRELSSSTDRELK